MHDYPRHPSRRHIRLAIRTVMVSKLWWCPSKAAPSFGIRMSMNKERVCRLKVVSPSREVSSEWVHPPTKSGLLQAPAILAAQLVPCKEEGGRGSCAAVVGRAGVEIQYERRWSSKKPLEIGRDNGDHEKHGRRRSSADELKHSLHDCFVTSLPVLLSCTIPAHPGPREGPLPTKYRLEPPDSLPCVPVDDDWVVFHG